MAPVRGINEKIIGCLKPCNFAQKSKKFNFFTMYTTQAKEFVNELNGAMVLEQSTENWV